ncbi:MAG: hypothetical protein LBS36_03730 [Oscillospiraceae bacterium]|jgi:hypothetical protein|nr:hypothetical protein [Oscillospiraceae bacterium]
MEAITYEDDIIGFIDSRIEGVMHNLLKTNPEFALAAERCNALVKNFNFIISHDQDFMMTAGDCADLKKYLEQDFIQTTIMHEELYRQGYLDCVKLLSMLGLIQNHAS